MKQYSIYETVSTLIETSSNAIEYEDKLTYFFYEAISIQPLAVGENVAQRWRKSGSDVST